MYNLEKFKPGMYLLPQQENMRVPGLIIATETLIKEEAIEKALEQVKNVACLPGIINYSIAMPDIHWGYGFPIGGVAAFDINEGIISPGGVGYDINCGVRLATISEKFSSLDDNTKEKLINTIFRTVPSGVGHGHRGKTGLSDTDYKNIAQKGIVWSVEKGFGFKEDIERCENKGCLQGADISAVSSHAKERGSKQVGTVGSGNHFIEIGEIEKIFEKDVANQWGIEEGQIYIFIHSGSRGFGHQICQDTINHFVKQGYAENLPDRQLVAAPLKSDDAKKYISAMNTAANFAFNNRQQILHYVRKAFTKVCNIPGEKIQTIYDVCHNIAKFEDHKINGKMTKVCVHRKGATRAFGAGSDELIALYRKTGQPVLVPGDMGRASYLLVGQGNELTWSSSCHGAGRAKSRIQSNKAWKGKNLKEHMSKQGVTILASSYRTIAEEMPDAYKDIDEVVKAVDEAELAKMVARLKPHLVVKG